MAFYSVQHAKHATLATAIAGSVATTTAGSASPATNEVQTITLTDGHVATGGTFTITYDGQTTSALAYDASGATISTAMDALSNLGNGDCVVTGTLNTGLTLTFSGAGVAATNVAQVTVSFASTTGYIYDRVILNGCQPGILRVRNRHTTGTLYFRAYTENANNKTPMVAVAEDDCYAVPYGDLTDIFWNNNIAYVYIISGAGSPYSVESIRGLN